MTGATLFSGILCPEVAMPWVDWKFCAEVDPFACAVIKNRRPNIANLGDVTAADFVDRAKAFGQIDLLVAGSPCQAFSVAGLRKSLDDARGNLTLRFVEIVNAIDPRFVLWENVPGVFSSHDNPFGCMLAGLVGADGPLLPAEECGGRWTVSGVVDGPLRSAAWVVRDAQYHGVPQRRRRVFVLAGRAGDRPHPGAVLFVAQGLQGDSAKGKTSRENVAPTISARTKGSGGLGTDFDLDGGLIASTGDVSHCLNAGGMHRIDYETETLIAHSLRGEGFDASEDGTGRGIPLVPWLPQGYRIQDPNGTCETLTSNPAGGMKLSPVLAPIAFSCKDHGADAGEIAPTLRSMNFDKSHANAGGQVAIAFNLRGREDGAQAEVSDVASVRAASGGSSRSYVAIGLDEEQNGSIDSSGCLKARKEAGGFQASVLQRSEVRRLLPTECEALMGLPRNWTLVPHRGKPTADGPRYKACGNGMAVPVVREIGECLRQCVALVEQEKSDEAA